MLLPLCGVTAPSVPTTRRLGGSGPNQGLPEPLGAELGPAVFLSSGLPAAVYVSNPSLNNTPAAARPAEVIAPMTTAIVTHVTMRMMVLSSRPSFFFHPWRHDPRVRI